MSQKGQIIKHEWVHDYKWFFKCSYCECVMVLSDVGNICYIPKDHKGASLALEPPCITRKTQTDGDSTTT